MSKRDNLVDKLYCFFESNQFHYDMYLLYQLYNLTKGSITTCLDHFFNMFYKDKSPTICSLDTFFDLLIWNGIVIIDNFYIFYKKPKPNKKQIQKENEDENKHAKDDVNDDVNDVKDNKNRDYLYTTTKMFFNPINRPFTVKEFINLLQTCTIVKYINVSILDCNICSITLS